MELSSLKRDSASSSSVDSHSSMAKMIHWGFILVFAYGLLNQVDEVEELEDFALLIKEVIFAAIFLVLLLARYIYMHSTRSTVMPVDTPVRIAFLARTVHLGMYISLAMIAVSGLMIGGLYWAGTKEGALMEALLLLHEIVFWLCMNLIAVHTVGAVYHRLRCDGVWSAMVPIWKENRRGH